jgi:hypothetical protein
MKTIAQQLNVTEFPFIIKDKRGNRIYFEESDGYWHKREYDSNNNQIYYEDSDGFWSKYEYDSNGKVLYFEDFTGSWYRKEYDSNGNQIYYEDSNGDIKDNRPTCNNKVVEIDGKKYKLVQL